jgi:ubiquinone/menaquinone biosynthesis C-methylase UbiE
MTDRNKQTHREKIVEQFSRQAIPFARVPGHLDALQLLVELSGVGREDTVLDVACGPGLVACEFARHAGTVTGIDITPTMIEQAEQRQVELGLGNLCWQVGEAVPLPFSDEAFSLVITRYSFHHFLDPERALTEMIRVCRPGGRVLVADVAVEQEKSAAYDLLEIMRDPSHVHALTNEEFEILFRQSGLVDCKGSGYGVPIELETQLRASFPAPEDVPTLRKMVISDIGVDRLGITARLEGREVVYTVPIAVYVGRKL